MTKKRSYHLYITAIIAGLGLLLVSCKKFLDEKPLQSTVVPSNLRDLQAILDNYTQMNQKGPQLLEALTDNYFITTATYNSRSVNDRMNYIWDKDATEYNNWYTPYTGPIYYANVVLDQLSEINYNAGTEQAAYNNVKGSALFFRAFYHYAIAQCYCRPYSTTAATDNGIVLRLTSNINVPSARSTVQQTYEQIIADLKDAARLLPDTALYPTRPAKPAAYGALARTYLAMADYTNASKYADSVLLRRNTLIDYNTLSPSANPVFPNFNKEVIFYSRATSSSLPIYLTGGRMDSTLVSSYNANDLRKALFFSLNADNTYNFRGSYEGAANGFWVFDGIAMDEMYLIRAECRARAGHLTEAMKDLNDLLVTRWKTVSGVSTYVNQTAIDQADAVNKILNERRRELVFRGLRWTDLRRLNLEGANITLKRVVNGVDYTLP
ncbi:MAG TPA: RagB/SusD family nutrient uptake outer membrane protein, partial [Chitinophagaceae bacterium]|nr:RagB/SusD family nutrient uptake outer membrane protein [Chitinophagaceae bacterium]